MPYPRMGYASRADLAAELCPRLPAAAVRQLARRTQTFAEVFAAAGAAGGTGRAAREGSAGYRGGSAASATA